MTTITLTFDDENKTGNAIAEAIISMEALDLTDSEKLATTQALYVLYRAASNIEVVPEATP